MIMGFSGRTLFCEVSLFCCIVLVVLSSFAIISNGKGEKQNCLLYFSVLLHVILMLILGGSFPWYHWFVFSMCLCHYLAILTFFLIVFSRV